MIEQARIERENTERKVEINYKAMLKQARLDREVMLEAAKRKKKPMLEIISCKERSELVTVKQPEFEILEQKQLF